MVLSSLNRRENNFMSLTQSPLQSATTILKLLASKSLTKEQLNKHQRRICVRYMLHEGKWTQQEMAEILGAHRTQIARDKAKIKEQDAMALDGIDERSFALDIIKLNEIAVARLLRKGKEFEAVIVQDKCLKSLQSLGYLERKPIEVKGHLTLLEVLNFASRNGNPQQSDNSQEIPLGGRGGTGLEFSES